jgi:hypothetical protein
MKIKFRIPEAFLGAFLAVSVFGMGMLFESARLSPIEQHATSDTAKENSAHSQERGFWNWVTHDAAGFFTLWLVIVGGAQVGLFYWQLRLIRIASDDAKRAGLAAERAADATAASVDLARDTAQRQLRAYIGTFEMSLRVHPLEGSGFGYITHIEIRNFGQTPAYEMMLWADTAVDIPGALLFSDTPESPVVSGGIAYPSAGLHIRRFKKISEAEVEEIRNRTKSVFFWGTVSYKDAFGSPRYFKFRLINTEQQLGQGGAYGMGPHEYQAN